MAVNIPSINVPLTDRNGRINPIWHEFLRSFVAASVDGTVSADNVSSTVTAGAGLTGGGVGNVTLNVGAGSGITVNANDVNVDINGQSQVQAALDDEVMIVDVSNNNAIRKSTVRNFVELSSPGGNDTQIQYNDSGIFSGDSGFTTNGAGSINIVGDLDVDNINLNGNTISTSTGNLNLAPNGSSSTYMGDNNNTLFWSGGTASTYCIGASGGTPFIRGADGNSQFIVTSTGYIISAGIGNTLTFSNSSGNLTLAGLNFVMSNTPLKRYVVAAITASTTQTQGNGALTGDINEISVCANANDTVTLPLASAGRQCLVINNGAQTLQVFPASGDNLGAGVDTSTTIVAASRKLFVAFDGTNWEPVI